MAVYVILDHAIDAYQDKIRFNNFLMRLYG